MHGENRKCSARSQESPLPPKLYAVDRRLGGPKGRPGAVKKPSLLLLSTEPRFPSRSSSSQPSHYTDRAIQPPNVGDVTQKITVVPSLRWLVAGLSPRGPGFNPKSVHVGFVVDKMALGQVSPLILRFSPSSFIPSVLHYTEKRKN